MLGRWGCGLGGKSISMRFVRTILAFAIALSLAMLPVGVSAVGIGTSSDAMQASMHVAGGADMSMNDCCPDDMNGTTSHTDGYKCGMGFCCAGATVALGDVRILAFEFFGKPAARIAIPADQVLSLHSGNPPFRPPRV